MRSFLNPETARDPVRVKIVQGCQASWPGGRGTDLEQRITWKPSVRSEPGAMGRRA
jgi:hypothetical protein